MEESNIEGHNMKTDQCFSALLYFCCCCWLDSSSKWRDQVLFTCHWSFQAARFAGSVQCGSQPHNLASTGAQAPCSAWMPLCWLSELFLQARRHRTGWAGSPVCCVPAGRDGAKPVSEFDFELQSATKGRTDSYNGPPSASETSNNTRRVTNHPHPSPDNLCYL